MAELGHPLSPFQRHLINGLYKAPIRASIYQVRGTQTLLKPGTQSRCFRDSHNMTLESLSEEESSCVLEDSRMVFAGALPLRQACPLLCLSHTRTYTHTHTHTLLHAYTHYCMHTAYFQGSIFQGRMFCLHPFLLLTPGSGYIMTMGNQQDRGTYVPDNETRGHLHPHSGGLGGVSN